MGAIYKFRSDRHLLVQSAILNDKLYPISDQQTLNQKSGNHDLTQKISLFFKVNKETLLGKSGTARFVVDI